MERSDMVIHAKSLYQHFPLQMVLIVMAGLLIGLIVGKLF